MQVEQAGGKVCVIHDVVMLGNYEATYLVAVDYSYLMLPESNMEIRIARKSFDTEEELLNYSLFRNIGVIRKEYLKNRKLHVSHAHARASL